MNSEINRRIAEIEVTGESIYPVMWFVAHSGFIQSGPHTEVRAKRIVELAEGCEWEAVEYRPTLAQQGEE